VACECTSCVADIEVTAELFVAVYRAGRADEAAERDAAEAAAWRAVAERVARCGPGHAELVRRREAALAAVPALTSEEIRAGAQASWAAMEAGLEAGIAVGAVEAGPAGSTRLPARAPEVGRC
jgi:hypothetical protein